ncbi:MAG TPA: hypothetical protein VGA04_16085 [Streptosporangiaceae bacterium]
MRRTSFEEMNCSVAQTLEVVGEWWTQPTCSECGALLDVRSLRLRPGPGAEHRPAPELRKDA